MDGSPVHQWHRPQYPCLMSSGLLDLAPQHEQVKTSGSPATPSKPAPPLFVSGPAYDPGMSSLLLEVRPPHSDSWHLVTMLGPGDRPQQLSIMTDSGRDVILFRCDGSRAVIYRPLRSSAVAAPLGDTEVHLVDGEHPLADLAGDWGVFELACQPAEQEPFDARWTFRAYD